MFTCSSHLVLKMLGILRMHVSYIILSMVRSSLLDLDMLV
jgi:hypothetical protein